MTRRTGKGGILHVDGDAVGRGLHFGQMIRLHEERKDVEGDAFRLECAGLELVHVEDVTHHGEERAGGLADLMTAVLQLFDISRMIVSDLYHAEDAIDRGADVVAHAAEEICLCLVGDLGFAGAFLELFLIGDLSPLGLIDILNGIEKGGGAPILVPTFHDEAAQVPDAIGGQVRLAESVSFPKAVGEGGGVEEVLHGCLGFGSNEGFSDDGDGLA